jgi:hypothetical protein
VKMLSGSSFGRRSTMANASFPSWAEQSNFNFYGIIFALSFCGSSSCLPEQQIKNNEDDLVAIFVPIIYLYRLKYKRTTKRYRSIGGDHFCSINKRRSIN